MARIVIAHELSGSISTPASGFTSLFIDPSDGFPRFKTSDGNVRLIVPSTRTNVAGSGLTGGGDFSADRTFNVGANADGSIVVNADDIQVGVINSTQHGQQTVSNLHALATTSSAGFASPAHVTLINSHELRITSLESSTGSTGLTNPHFSQDQIWNDAGTFRLNTTGSFVANVTGSALLASVGLFDVSSVSGSVQLRAPLGTAFLGASMVDLLADDWFATQAATSVEFFAGTYALFNAATSVSLIAGTEAAYRAGTKHDFKVGSANPILTLDVSGSSGRTTFKNSSGEFCGEMLAGASGSIKFTSTGSLQHRVATPVSDIVAPDILIKGANAYVSASTAPKKLGGNVIIEPGRSTTPGTDESGTIYVGIGDLLGETSAVGMFLGYGAAQGTPGEPGYVPYTTAFGRHGVVGGSYEIRGLRPLTIRTVTAGHNFSIVSSDAFSIVSTGLASMTATGAGAYIMCPAVNTLSLNGGNIEFRSGSRISKFQNYNASEDRFIIQWPANVGTAAVTRTVLLTIAIPTGPAIRCRASIKGWPAAGAGQQTIVDFWAENVAGVVNKFTPTITNIAGTTVLGTIDVTVNTTNIEIGVTPGAATAYTWRVNTIEDN